MKNCIPIKKYTALFAFLFVASVLVLIEHFNESPLDLDEIRGRQAFNKEKSEIGFLAPGFTLKNLAGNYDGLANYADKVVVLNFWATWCAPCRVEMPSFEKLYRRYRSEGLTVLAISLGAAGVDTSIVMSPAEPAAR